MDPLPAPDGSGGARRGSGIHLGRPADDLSPAVVLFVAWWIGACGPGPAREAGGPARPEGTEAPRFVRVTGGAPVADRASTGGVSWADADADGDADLFVTNGYDVTAAEPVQQGNRLYRNEGRGRLVPADGGPLPADSGFSSGSTWTDVDGDGGLDVFVSNQRGQDNFLYRSDGDGGLRRVRDAAPSTDGGASFAASWVDVDRDGLPDLHVTNGGLAAAEPDFLYRNLGDWTFERVRRGPVVSDTAASGGGAWADYDGDGDPDLFVPRRLTPGHRHNGLYRNEGGFRFTRIRRGPVATDEIHSVAAAWGDYDNDGDPDLYVGGLFGLANRLYRNGGDGTFARVPSEAGPHVRDGGHTYGVSWADWDNDGDLDLVTAQWGAAPVAYENRGEGIFVRAESGDLGRAVTYGSSLAWSDHDGDGDLDLYVGSWPNRRGDVERNALYRNDGPAGHWLRVRLRGTASSPTGLGARVVVRTPAVDRGTGRVQTREMSGQSSWRSQDEPVLHFGLGTDAVASEVTVRWPSGRVERWRAIGGDRAVLLREGEAP